MLSALLSVVLYAGVLWGVVYAHELGHYYAGRRIVGVPASEIRVVSHPLPRYVALRQDGEWVPPTEFDRYREAYEQFDPEFEHLERYVAAGELVQAGIVVPAAVAVALAGPLELAVGILLLSVLTTAIYVLVDAGLTLSRGSPSGDYSTLWQVSPWLPFFVLFGFLSTHVVPLLVFL